MAELINKFTWSFSAAEDFEECRRKRYWAKYAMWNGWKPDASPLQRSAYRLGKMDNRYTLQGRAVESGVMWALRRCQEGKESTVEEAYNEAARPLLNRAWRESRDRLWVSDPKRRCCLREHYYGALTAEKQDEWVSTLIEHIQKCIGSFIASVLPRLRKVARSREIEVSTVEAGDPESFALDSVKIYAIPDYVYRADDGLWIHDWKSGKARQSHKSQMGLYGLWASIKHGMPAEKIHVNLEYLLNGSVESRTLNEEDLEAVKKEIRESVCDMTEYLVDGDTLRNEPIPMEEWELAATTDKCVMCNFLELCASELREGGMDCRISDQRQECRK